MLSPTIWSTALATSGSWTPLLKHFTTTLLREIDQHAIDLAAKKLYPKAGPATRNRQVFTPASACSVMLPARDGARRLHLPGQSSPRAS